MHLFNLWICIPAILIFLAASAIPAGVLGWKWSQAQQHQQQCERRLSSPNALSCSDPNDPIISSDLPSRSASGELFASSCTSLSVWQSNLTSTKWTSVCNADLSTYMADWDRIASAIVPSFDACIRTCDAMTWNNMSDISVATWSWSGNSSAGIETSPQGKCWCIQTWPLSGYVMNATLGMDAALRGGTFDVGTIGTTLDDRRMPGRCGAVADIV